MALGLYAGLPGWVEDNRIPPEVWQATYLVNAPGYSNVSATPCLIIFAAGFLIIVAAFPTGTREDEKLLFERLLQRIARR